MRSGVFILVLLLLLVFVLGIVLASRGPSPEYRAAMEVQRLETQTKMAALKVVFWHILTGIGLLFLAGLAIAFLRLLWQRSQLIRPNVSGIFPVVRGSAGRQVLRPGSGCIYYHDPNRQLAGTTAYGTGPDGTMQAQHLFPPGQEEAQLQITSQAQAAQVVAAAQPEQADRATRRLVDRLTKPKPAPSMPEIQVVEGEIVDADDRLLLTAIRQDWSTE